MAGTLKVEKESIQEQVSSSSGILNKLALYRRSMVGDGGNISFILYELINLLFIPIPGKIGVLLRKLVFPLLVGKMGKSVCIDANCIIRNGKRIAFGDNVLVGQGVTLDVKPGDNKLILHNNVTIGTRAILNCSGGEINIGEQTVIGNHCRLGSIQGITIGHHCTIGQDSCLVGGGHSTDNLEKPIVLQPGTCDGPNFIGDHVIIGERVTLLNGIRVGSHVIIHSDSLILNNVPDGFTMAGSPAVMVKEESKTEKKL